VTLENYAGNQGAEEIAEQTRRNPWWYSRILGP